MLIANHHDTLTGGAGSDTFVFGSGFGKCTVTDFDVNKDALQFAQSPFSSVSQIFAHSKDTAGGMVISVDSANTVTLVGVHVADFQGHQDLHLI